jgi:hypothetical protein
MLNVFVNNDKYNPFYKAFFALALEEIFLSKYSEKIQIVASNRFHANDPMTGEVLREYTQDIYKAKEWTDMLIDLHSLVGKDVTIFSSNNGSYVEGKLNVKNNTDFIVCGQGYRLVFNITQVRFFYAISRVITIGFN